MNNRFYFDTSIWLDFFENRDEPNLPKSKWARELVKKITIEEDNIVFSDNNMIELIQLGYSEFEIEELLSPFKNLIIVVEATEKQLGVSKEFSS